MSHKPAGTRTWSSLSRSSNPGRGTCTRMWPSFQVVTEPGRATATFRLGDFSGCLGASCGDPVALRDAHVTLADGVLSTRIERDPAKLLIDE